MLPSASIIRLAVASFSTTIHQSVEKCGNDHITWPKTEFVELLSQDVNDLMVQRKLTDEIPNKMDTSSRNMFQQLACAMERLISLQTFDDADTLVSRFKVIDPDRVKLEPSSVSNEETRDCEKEMNFLIHLSPFLKQAGFSEIDKKEIEYLLSTHHVYDDIEVPF